MSAPRNFKAACAQVADRVPRPALNVKLPLPLPVRPTGWRSRRVWHLGQISSRQTTHEPDHDAAGA